MSTPSRFIGGIGTAPRHQSLALFGMPDPTKWNVFFDDFHRYVAGDWTITTTEAGAGDATEALGNIDGGCLVVTNDAADNDADFFQKVGACMLPAVRKRTLGKVRFKVSDATQCDWIFGLCIPDTTPIAADGDGVTDGIFFQKDDGDLNLDFYVQKNATTGQLTTAAWTTAAADDTFMTLGFAYDGKRTIKLYKNDSHIKTVDLTGTPTDYLPDIALTPTFGIMNGEAVAKILTVDYLFFAQER